MKKCSRCNRDIKDKNVNFHWCHKCFHVFSKIKDDKAKRRVFCNEKYMNPACLFIDSDDEEN